MVIAGVVLLGRSRVHLIVLIEPQDGRLLKKNTQLAVIAREVLQLTLSMAIGPCLRFCIGNGAP